MLTATTGFLFSDGSHVKCAKNRAGFPINFKASHIQDKVAPFGRLLVINDPEKSSQFLIGLRFKRNDFNLQVATDTVLLLESTFVQHF